MTCLKIGGEFEIDPTYLNQNSDSINLKGFFFSSGRVAFHAILDFLKKNKNVNEILLPEYLCQSVLIVTHNNHLKISFYQLDKNLDLNQDLFPKETKNKAILLINYFGLKNMSDTISFLRKSTFDCTIILDNVQAFFDMTNKTQADFAFTSFRKFFPVPDGGWLTTNNKDFRSDNLIENSSFSAKKLIGGLIKHYALKVPINDDIYLKFLKEGEGELDNYRTITSISNDSLLILSNLYSGFGEIIRRRNVNAKFVLEQLTSLQIETLFPISAEIKAPLAIPIKLKNRDIVRKRLIENRIYLPIHWPVPESVKYNSNLGFQIAKIELSLIVDQRYSPDILNRIFEVFHQCQNDDVF